MLLAAQGKKARALELLAAVWQHPRLIGKYEKSKAKSLYEDLQADLPPVAFAAAWERDRKHRGRPRPDPRRRPLSASAHLQGPRSFH